MSRKAEKPTVQSVTAAEGNLCRYCDKLVELVDAVITFSYWQGIPFICHRVCKDAGVKQEAFDCQVIDADCNDCKHYKRGLMIDHGVWNGHCLKFDKPTLAFPVKWTGRPCFEHRKL